MAVRWTGDSSHASLSLKRDEFFVHKFNGSFEHGSILANEAKKSFFLPPYVRTTTCSGDDDEMERYILEKCCCRRVSLLCQTKWNFPFRAATLVRLCKSCFPLISLRAAVLVREMKRKTSLFVNFVLYFLFSVFVGKFLPTFDRKPSRDPMRTQIVSARKPFTTIYGVEEPGKVWLNDFSHLLIEVLVSRKCLRKIREQRVKRDFKVTRRSLASSRRQQIVELYFKFANFSFFGKTFSSFFLLRKRSTQEEEKMEEKKIINKLFFLRFASLFFRLFHGHSGADENLWSPRVSLSFLLFVLVFSASTFDTIFWDSSAMEN